MSGSTILRTAPTTEASPRSRLRASPTSSAMPPDWSATTTAFPTSQAGPAATQQWSGPPLSGYSVPPGGRSGRQDSSIRTPSRCRREQLGWAANLPATWEDAGRPFEGHAPRHHPRAAQHSCPSQGAQVLVHQDLHARNVLAAQREPWLVIDPKPLAGEVEFAVVPIIRGSERGPSGDAVAHRIDRLTDGLGLDRERALDWAIA